MGWNDQTYALLRKICSCESGGNPKAQNGSSSAAGLCQIIKGTWGGTRAGQRYGWQNRYNIEANWDVAKELFNYGAGKSHWNPSRGCWG